MKEQKCNTLGDAQLLGARRACCADQTSTALKLAVANLVLAAANLVLVSV